MNHLNLATSTKDIYIKKSKNNIAVVLFRTQKAKKFAKQSNVPNHYQGEDRYGIEINSNQAIRILSWAISHNMSVDSEVAMVIEDKRNLS